MSKASTLGSCRKESYESSTHVAGALCSVCVGLILHWHETGRQALPVQPSFLSGQLAPCCASHKQFSEDCQFGGGSEAEAGA